VHQPVYIRADSQRNVGGKKLLENSDEMNSVTIREQFGRVGFFAEFFSEIEIWGGRGR
jgi:hypothetical protein